MIDVSCDSHLFSQLAVFFINAYDDHTFCLFCLFLKGLDFLLADVFLYYIFLYIVCKISTRLRQNFMTERPHTRTRSPQDSGAKTHEVSVTRRHRGHESAPPCLTGQQIFRPLSSSPLCHDRQHSPRGPRIAPQIMLSPRHEWKHDTRTHRTAKRLIRAQSHRAGDGVIAERRGFHWHAGALEF